MTLQGAMPTNARTPREDPRNGTGTAFYFRSVFLKRWWTAIEKAMGPYAVAGQSDRAPRATVAAVSEKGMVATSGS